MKEDAVQEARRLAELGLLTAGLIHELRQPVFAIKALLQIVERDPARCHECFPQVLSQVLTLEALLAGYGDFSRRPAGPPEVFDLRAPVESALVVIRHRAQAAAVPLVLDCGEAVAVRASILAIQQALVNLGQNAVDALRGVPDGRLRITTGRRAGEAWIRVEDNGPGLPPEIRAHLFEPFHTTKATGTGLGLAISRDMITSCGGELRLLEGEGTRWEIALPASGDG